MRKILLIIIAIFATLTAKSAETKLISGNFANLSNYSYTSDKTILLGPDTWLASYSQFNSSVFYLGTNSKNKSKSCLTATNWSDLRTFLGYTATSTSPNPSYYALRNDNSLVNVKSITFSWTGLNTAGEVLILANEGEGIKQLSSASVEKGTNISGSITYTYENPTTITQLYFVYKANATDGTIKNISYTVTSVESEPPVAELTAPTISIAPTKEDNKYYVSEAPTVSISYPTSATLMTINVNGTEEIVTAEWSEQFTEVGTYTIAASATDGTSTMDATPLFFSIEADPIVEAKQYKLVTSATELEIGAKYLIASNNSGTAYAMSAVQDNNNRKGVSIEIVNKVISITSETVSAFTLQEGISSGQYSFYDELNSGYLYAASSSNNHLKTKSTLDNNGSATIEISSEGLANIVFQGSYTHNIMRWNSGNSLFACYESGQKDVYLYKEVTGEVVETTLTPVITPADGAEFDESGLIVYITAEEGATIYYTIDGTEPNAESNVYDATTGISISGANDVTLKAIAIAVNKEASATATATFKFKSSVIVNPTEKKYSLVTSDSELEVGARYVFVGLVNKDSQYYANSSFNNDHLVAIKINAPVNNEITITDEAVEPLILCSTDIVGKYAFKIESSNFFISRTGANLITAETIDDNSKSVITFENGKSTILMNSDLYNLQFNAQNPRFKAYNTNQQPIYLYKEIGEPIETQTVGNIEEFFTAGESAESILDDNNALSVRGELFTMNFPMYVVGQSGESLFVTDGSENFNNCMTVLLKGNTDDSLYSYEAGDVIEAGSIGYFVHFDNVVPELYINPTSECKMGEKSTLKEYKQPEVTDINNVLLHLSESDMTYVSKYMRFLWVWFDPADDANGIVGYISFPQVIEEQIYGPRRAYAAGTETLKIYNLFDLTSIPKEAGLIGLTGVLDYSAADGVGHRFVPTSVDIATEVETITDNNQIYVLGNSIIAPNDAEIFSINGIKVNGADLENGIYLVKVGSKITKLIIQ